MIDVTLGAVCKQSYHLATVIIYYVFVEVIHKVSGNKPFIANKDRRVESEIDKQPGNAAGSDAKDRVRRLEAALVACAAESPHGEYLAANRNTTITVEGHCDERGSREYNMALGERRANTVKRFLEAQGVSGRQASIISYGEERPATTGHDEQAWAENRRAVLVY